MDIGLVNLGLVLVCARVLCWHRSCLWYILTTLAICANQRVVYTLYCMLMTAHRPTVAYCSRLYPMIMTCIAVLSTSEVAGECLPADCLGEQWQCIHYRWVFTCWLSRWTVTMYTLQVSVYLLTVSVNSDNVYITGECLPADCLGEQWQRIHYRWAFTCWLSWWTVTMYTFRAGGNHGPRRNLRCHPDVGSPLHDVATYPGSTTWHNHSLTQSINQTINQSINQR